MCVCVRVCASTYNMCFHTSVCVHFGVCVRVHVIVCTHMCVCVCVLMYVQCMSRVVSTASFP